MFKNGDKMKKKIVDIILISSVLGCLVALIYSSYNIYIWYKGNEDIETQMEEVKENVEIEVIEDTKNTEIVNPTLDKQDPYWDYIKVNLIDVDFNKLKKINQDVVLWLQVNGTNINYPVVQTKNNKFYLNHQLDKSYNKAGWVFMDYRNDSKNFNQNTIIYAHGRLNNTMFGSLRKVIKKEWYQNKDNHVVKISTETENSLWQVFSTYRIKTTSDYLETTFSSKKEYLEFLNMLKERSIYNYNVNLNENDQIITLSTCHNDKEKIVLHAKLIKKETKK